MEAPPAGKTRKASRRTRRLFLTGALLLVLSFVVMARGAILEVAFTCKPLSIFLLPFVDVSTQNLPARGRRTQIESESRSILAVAQAIYTDTGKWPESIEEMVNPQSQDGKPPIASLENFPKDPWGNEYRYEILDGQARVTCLGNDNAEGGEGEAEDVIRPEPQGGR